MGFLGQKMAAMVVVVWVAMMAAAARGQTAASCASNLVPCAQYVNNTNTPAETCCGPLRTAETNETSCLCALYKSPEILKAFGITLEKGRELSRRCGITNQLSCDTGAPASAPPATPGGGSGSGHRASWFGITGLTSLLFFWWSILA
ncbi:non-specific lipid transfer protein GPI-anchored 8-like [Phoenix dactylifera]|uniref:Non-specific lipid transfer protein GPI-anchored 8-like n=1 Tax=Phoenix dactylifera TaxID=42345 RepID=A0A8B8J2F7_PHODC|nr:non-specific lipid transfer protein GPI-anchored 8-like [Phoenix dactylifera]